jgi:hypothetical protein
MVCPAPAQCHQSSGVFQHHQVDPDRLQGKTLTHDLPGETFPDAVVIDVRSYPSEFVVFVDETTQRQAEYTTMAQATRSHREAVEGSPQ